MSAKRPKASRSVKAGLVFPVGRICRYMKAQNLAKRVSIRAAVYLTAVLEYMTAEMLEVSGITARANKKQRITSRHIRLALEDDELLGKIFDRTIVPHGGVRPFIEPALLVNKTR
ncbi:histone H2A [Favolaschia claudopus]|uniref:Histone H2A n=1 Tax=Favolaschia claudopus TaxID=2862362 RepID=A0AAV9ZXV2_9AGAR